MKHNIVKKNLADTELSEFNKKFLDKKKSYIITYDMIGNIVSVDTTDKEILDYLKKLGLK